METSQIFKPEETVASQPPKNLAMPQYPAREYATEEEKWKDRMHRQLGEEFCKATEEFSCKTASQLLKDEKGNATYSPISLYFALSMAAGGAEGETKAQILKLLEFEEENDLAQSCRQAYDVFYDITDGYQLQIASSLWANQKIEMKQPFLDQTQEFYFAEVYKGDFSLEETKKSMGRWVKEHTGGLIEPSIELDDQTVLSIMKKIPKRVHLPDLMGQKLPVILWGVIHIPIISGEIIIRYLLWKLKMEMWYFYCPIKDLMSMNFFSHQII